MDDALKNLIGSVFGGQIWHSTSLLERVGEGNALGTMIMIGYGFAALMLIFQLVLMVFNISRTSSIWENVGPLMFRTVIIAALMAAPLYNLIFRYTIAETTNMMANAIFSSYASDFLESWKNVFAGSGNAPSTPWQIIVASFNNSLVSNILSSIIFLAAIVCVFIVTMLQPFLWLFCYYCGPICLAFAICDLTVHVARNWLNMFLIVNFVGIFGSISFVVAQAAGLVSNFEAGTTGNNIILVAVYGVMSIVFFCLIWPLTGYIFSGQSPLGNTATPQAAIGAALSGGIAYGAGMVGAGNLLSRFGGGNPVLGQIANGMQSHGSSIIQNASNISRVMHGSAPYKSGTRQQPQGSQQRESSIPLSPSSSNNNPASAPEQQKPSV
ncbi:MAG: hypothetical protein JXB48_11060 [Candidatus Latescibacteria bacterium]|nr:hypothetical protein [Candidatus Latescibacterota bacterium]